MFWVIFLKNILKQLQGKIHVINPLTNCHYLKKYESSSIDIALIFRIDKQLSLKIFVLHFFIAHGSSLWCHKNVRFFMNQNLYFCGYHPFFTVFLSNHPTKMKIASLHLVPPLISQSLNDEGLMRLGYLAEKIEFQNHNGHKILPTFRAIIELELKWAICR